MTGFPLPGTGRVAVAVPPPGPGPGRWVGAPSAVQDRDGGFVVAYRVRVTDQRGAATVVAHSADGEQLTTVAVLDKAPLRRHVDGAAGGLRTAEGRWRLYVCCATPGSKHWWIDVLEADDPAGLADAEARTVFGGDDRAGVKDPVVRSPGRPLARLDLLPPAGRAGRGGPHDHRLCDQRGRAGLGLARHRAGPPARDLGRPRGQGHRRPPRRPGQLRRPGHQGGELLRAHRPGPRWPGRPGGWSRTGDGPVADVRYLEVVPLRAAATASGTRPRSPDGSHELRTELIT